MKKLLLFISAACLALTGCDPDKPLPPEEVITSPGQPDNKIEVAVEAEESSDREVTFTATSNWTASVVETSGTRATVGWIRLIIDGSERYSGPAGTYTATIEIDANPSNAFRSATNTISCGDNNITIIISQGTPDGGGDDPELDVLTKIPDPAFLEYCKWAMKNEYEYWDSSAREDIIHPVWDTDGDGRLSETEAAAVISIDVSWVGEERGDIKSLAGIEYFTGLIRLECNYNLLTSLDLSKNTAMKHLDCASSQLTSLDVSKNTALTYLNCEGNQLSSLDVSGCIELESLIGTDNRLLTLDVSNNTALTDLWCDYNELTSLDISNNTALMGLVCANNPGDGVSKFPVTAWFGNNSIPDGFTTDSWDYDGTTITPDYQMVN
jgi:hypothetical protein